MRKQHTGHAVPATRSTRADLPPDLGHPPDPGRASFIANIVSAAVLLAGSLALLAYALLAVRW